MTPHTLADWLDHQQGIHARGIELGLDRVRAAWQALGARRPAPIVVTVGGTNGKGTTVAMLEAMLAAAGHRVAAYTSPHLVRYTERLRIDRAELDEAAWVAVFERIERARGDVPLTWFEFGTLAALELVADAGVDVALLEVGLGGRLDAVNIVDADVAVVTSIGIDHTEYLGPDRDSIGREKAGIFRAGHAAVIGDRDPPHGLLDAAARIGARVLRVGRDFDVAAGRSHAPSPQPSPPTMKPPGEREPEPSPPSSLGGEGWVRGRGPAVRHPGIDAPTWPDGDTRLEPGAPPTMKPPGEREPEPSPPSSLGGEGWVRGRGPAARHPGVDAPTWHGGDTRLELDAAALDAPGRLDNAACALAALHALRGTLGWPAHDYARGLASVALPARVQRIAGPPEIVVDVAHNPHAARALADWLDRHPPAGRTLAVFSALADKDIAAIGAILGPHVARWHLCALADAGSRSLDAAEVMQRLRAGWPALDAACHADPPAALAAALGEAARDDRILAFGSFHLAGSVLAAMRQV